jgi:hypothetical protein
MANQRTLRVGAVQVESLNQAVRAIGAGISRPPVDERRAPAQSA